jgi:hypothetical protein
MASEFKYTRTRFKLRFKLVQFRPEGPAMTGQLRSIGECVQCAVPLGEKLGLTLTSTE